MAKLIIEQMKALATVDIVPVSLDVAERAAGYRHSLGLSTADAIILAAFTSIGCDVLLTKDTDFRRAEEQNIIAIEWLN